MTQDIGSGMGLDEFLGHTSTARGGGRAKTAKWKDRTPPQMDTWLHTRGKIIALWKHGWQRLVEREEDGRKVLLVWSADFNCWEPEAVLKKQYQRYDDGRRKVPPTTCPMCLVNEYIRDQVRTGKLSWTAPVFEFKGTEDRQVLTAGGMCKLFDAKDLTRGQLDELRRAGIRRDEAWKQNTQAKCSYVFQIVDNDDLDAGVQVAIETTALGYAVKDTIREQMEGLGEQEGNPLRTPYAIRWKYRPDEVEFAKKYAALALPKLRLEPKVRELIYDAALPDLQPFIERGNPEGLRAIMEKTALIAFPWDQLFEPADRARGKQSEPTEPRPVQAQVPAGTSRRQLQEPPKAKGGEFPPGTVTVPCDTCGKAMPETATECWNCGAKYEVTVEEPVAQAPAAPPPAERRPPTEPTDAGAQMGDDDIPFD